MRRRLCEAATRRLSLAGYHRTSLQDVVKEAGVSIGALQHHFGTKEALVVATATFLLKRSINWYAKARAELGRRSFAEMAERSWREQFRSDEYGALLEILVAARTDVQLRKAVAPALRRWRDAFEKEMTKSGGDAESLERDIVFATIARCMMTGLLVHDELLRDRARINRAICAVAEMAAAR